MAPRTLYDKIWDDHVVHQADDGTCLLYIDRHLVHEVTSPQAFEGLRMTGRKVRAPEKTIAVPDHNVPTTLDRANAATMTEDSRVQVAALDTNAKEFGINYYPVSDVRQGIVHIVGPEQGWTLPGMTVVCGDSHTATHGAFGALAHGIGTSEVEHVLATQTLIQRKAKNMKVEITGSLRPGVTAKDITWTVQNTANWHSLFDYQNLAPKAEWQTFSRVVQAKETAASSTDARRRPSSFRSPPPASHSTRGERQPLWSHARRSSVSARKSAADAESATTAADTR